jgi:ketosteroid isomerase-like protein
MRLLILSVASLLLFAACGEPPEDKVAESPETNELELQAVDASFSAYSKEHGLRKAFLEYIDEDGVMMRDNAYPFKGASAIRLISAMDDKSVRMTWEPRGGDIAASGDLGYTYGIYEMHYADKQVERGTYVTIWKKQPDGSWKFVLDSGNQGLGDEP